MSDDHTQGPDVSAVLRDAIAAFAHPQAWRRLKDAIDGLAAMRAEHDALRAASDALLAEQKKLRAEMASEQEAHRRVLQDERQRLNSEINARRNEVMKAEAAIAEAKKVAENDARQAAETRAKWQQKINLIDASMRA